jgi:alkaline phosphatase isozyme conversion protein
MINLDSLLAGDKIYVYGSADEGGWIRDLSLDIAKQRKIPLETNPGINPEYPKGTTGDWSDHAPFQAAGIPIGYFEATNWEIGELDGYTQTVELCSHY